MTAFISAMLFSVGTWMLFSRDWLRTVVGISMLSHGVNLVLIRSMGPTFQDPLPQALVLTAIVIGFSFQAFLLALGVIYFKRTIHADLNIMPEDKE